MVFGGLFFLSLLGWALCLMLWLPRLRAGLALLCAVSGMLFVAYYGVIVVQLMAPTAILLMYGGLAGLVVGVAGVILNWRGLRKRVLTAGMIGYLATSLTLVLITRDLLICDHDSFSYWMRIVRELYLFQRFPIHMDTTMYHSDYFPMLASLQYAVVNSFGWQDASLCYVTAGIVLASLAAIADLMEHKLWSAGLFISLCYGFTVFGFSYLDLRADGAMAAVFTAGVLCLYCRDGDSPTALLPAFLAVAVLAGFKIYSGLMLALCLCTGMLMSVHGLKKRQQSFKPMLWMGLTSLALCFIMQLSWSGLYHYSTAMAAYENAAAVSAYTGEATSQAAPALTLGALFSGNPRTGSFLHSLNNESLQAVSSLIGDTFTSYANSSLPWLWLFVLPCVPMALLGGKQERKQTLAVLLTLIAAGSIYLLGLFGSYLVQAETAPAATTYLITVPLLLAALFFVFKGAAAGRAALAGRIAAPLMIAGMLVLLPGSRFVRQNEPDTAYDSYSGLAYDFYNGEIAGLLTETDAGKHALLIDCSYAAADVKSESGKTHAYQYFALPLRVHVLQYPVADYNRLEEVDSFTLLSYLNNNRCDILILRVEDDLYWEAIRDSLELYHDDDMPTGVYDIQRENGELTFTTRGETMW